MLLVIGCAATNQAIRARLPDNMPVNAVNRAGQSDEAARNQILTGLNSGPALVTFAGHGSVGVWTGAGLLRASDAATLTNGARLPVVVSLTCLNGYFANPHTQSLAESLLLAPDGGAAAVWASSALTLPDAQAGMSQAFFRVAYRNEATRIGEAIRQAKAATANREVRQTLQAINSDLQRHIGRAEK